VTAPEFSFPGLFDSIWQLVDAHVLFPVRVTAEGEAPALMQTPEGEAVPTWVIQVRAEGMRPDGFVLRQTPLAELIRKLQPEAGIVIEPASPQSIYISPEARRDLVRFTVPFPDGARTAWGELDETSAPLVRALRTRVEAGIDGLVSLRAARFQVEDARSKIALVYEATNQRDRLVNDALRAVVAKVRPAEPVQIISMADVPAPTINWLEAVVPGL
jgi:hypothetical protein